MKTSPLVALLLTILVTEVTSIGRLEDLCDDFYETCPSPGVDYDFFIDTINIPVLSRQCENSEQKSYVPLRFSYGACPVLLSMCPSLPQKMSGGRKICSQIMCEDAQHNTTICKVGI